MSMPSAFELGGAIGSNISKGLREGRDLSAMDRILEEATESKEPEAYNNAIQGILRSVSPERQPLAISFLKQKQEQIIRKKSQEEQNRLADEIERAQPGSRTHQLFANIYRSDLPLDEKQKMIKGISGTIPFKAEQQERLQMDSVLKRYNSRIKEVEASIKAASYSQRPELEKLKKSLQDERDLLLNFKSLQKEDEKVAKKELNEEQALKFLEEADGDMEKAREKAREAGYEF